MTNTNTSPPKPHTGFDWAVYADATFAGLSALIPVPGIDAIFETLFRRRIAPTIAKRRKYQLAKGVKQQLSRSDQGCFASCLLLPVTLTFGLVKKLSRKILYFLTVKEAADNVSYYWHQAFLFDYALACGHLEDEEWARVGKEAARQTLQETTTSPLYQLAIQVTAGTHFIFRSLFKARRGKEDTFVEQKKSLMEKSWDAFGDYFTDLAANYHQNYHEILALQNRLWKRYPGKYVSGKTAPLEIQLNNGRISIAVAGLPETEAILVWQRRHTFRVRGGDINGNIAFFHLDSAENVIKLRLGMHLFIRDEDF